MSLVLTLEQAPRQQAVRQMRLETGALMIGRAPDADWRIDDPAMFVSRRHCTIAATADGFTVTDTSTGGLFIDDADRPLGDGRVADLRDGMRLRLGEFVLRVALPAAPRRDAAPLPSAGFDDFFAAPRNADPPPARPEGLPDLFEDRPSGGYVDDAPEPAAERRGLPVFDDPLTLDPPPSPPSARDAFAWDDAPAVTARETTRPARAPSGQGAASDDLRGAFLRGLGIDPAALPARDAAAEMEAFGRTHLLMIEGYMHLLRKRAEEKGEARLAQTTIGAAEVNPLKFMPGAEAALAAMLMERAGFLDAEAAVAGAVRDLAGHHVAAWRGVQAALRRMIDRFDPAALEKELEGLSALRALMGGGRRAMLWELYEARFREIARSAETRFLGEVGADFRDAYEKGEE